MLSLSDGFAGQLCRNCRKIQENDEMNTAYVFSFTEPINPEDLLTLYQQTDWAKTRGTLDIQRMLDNSQITLGVWADDRLIAFARVVTDDVYRALIDDVVVDAAFRGQGIGSQMIEKLLKRQQHVEVVMLDCDPDLADYYARSGFYIKKGCSMQLVNNA